MSQEFRKQAVTKLTTEIGVYAVVDLDAVPLYVGQSVDGIRSRVQRHLTSARSDIIANRQVDPWEVAEVWAWPTVRELIGPLEAALFRHFDDHQTLMNGSTPTSLAALAVREPDQKIAVMPDDERRRRLTPEIRLPRQIEHYNRLVDYILNVKDAAHLRRSARAHFERLSRYHAQLLVAAVEPIGSQDIAPMAET